MNRRPRLYFSFRSPYSWLAIHRLRQAVPDAFEALDWYPYWDPDQKTTDGLAERGAELHYAQMSRAKHFYLLVDTKRLAQRHNLPMAWPIDIEPWWELPHLAWLAARKAGLAEPFYDAVVSARWQRGEDVCTPEVLTAAARTAGFDPDIALGAVDDPAIRAEGVDCLHAAYDDDIFGIPYFRIGRHRFWGLDRLDDFLGTWLRDAPPPLPEPPVPVAAVGAYDTDTAGGCG